MPLIVKQFLLTEVPNQEGIQPASTPQETTKDDFDAHLTPKHPGLCGLVMPLAELLLLDTETMFRCYPGSVVVLSVLRYTTDQHQGICYQDDLFPVA